MNAEEPSTTSDGEMPEYRVYVDSRGAIPLYRDVIGEDYLAELVAQARQAFPNDRIYVREVLETVVKVYDPQKGEIAITRERRESEATKQFRKFQPIHCIEEVEGGFQTRYLLPGDTKPIVSEVKQTYREAVLVVPSIYQSASLDRDLFDAEVKRRSNPAR